MMKNEPAFVSFEKNQEEYNAFIAIDGFLLGNDDLESLLKRASTLYNRYLSKMLAQMSIINTFRTSRRPLPARKIWQLGDLIFGLVNELNGLSLQIDGIYDHLERDLKAKRKWLEKVIIFRRYIPEERMIPEHLNWGKCEKGTRRVAELIQKGRFPHSENGF
jgi:hypothetical protein